MRKILLLRIWLFSGLWDMDTEAMSVTGDLRKSIEIKCSHTNAFSNIKYFCKDPCRNEDVLISSKKKDSNGKYNIRDEGNTFYVTISDLIKDDAGTYWCGIDRVGVDTYNKVILTVKEGGESSIGTTVVVQKPTTPEQPAGLLDMETKAMSVTGELGKSIEIKCSHTNAFYNNTCFCKDPCRDEDVLISSKKKDSNGKYSIRDEGNTLNVNISGLIKDDAGTYWCGIGRFGVDTYNKVILTVKEGGERSIGNTVVVQKPTTPEQPAEHNLPLFLTAVMCVTALLFVCLFTLCLLRIVKHWRSGPLRNKETLSNNENMTSGVRTEPELPCGGSPPDSADLSASSPPDLCSHFTTSQRESTVSFGLSEYDDVDVSGYTCQYQHLDLSRLEEHVYDSLHGHNGPKDEPLAAKEEEKIKM